MKMQGKVIYIMTLLILFYSCQSDVKNHLAQLVKEWEGKEILFPSNSVFTIQGKDTIEYSGNNSTYKIVTYVDSVGCTSCKLQLPRWKDFIHEVNSSNHDSVPFLFYFYPKDKSELYFLFRRENFDYPVCLDENDNFNKLNHFHSDIAFQTFLLNRDNKVIAIGNPIRNLKVKELYLKKILGKSLKPLSDKDVIKTKVDIAETFFSLGNFDWQKEQKVTFTLKNTGAKPLVIENVSTSCGCTSVSYSKEPVRSGNSVILNVSYKADHPEHFNKTITVYCNAESSPILLRIAGNAE